MSLHYLQDLNSQRSDIESPPLTTRPELPIWFLFTGQSRPFLLIFVLFTASF